MGPGWVFNYLTGKRFELSNVKKKTDDIWKVNDGIWKCTIIISEWTADYGTFAETERTFIGRDPELVAILALKAAIGVGERLLVGDLPND